MSAMSISIPVKGYMITCEELLRKKERHESIKLKNKLNERFNWLSR